MVLTRFPTLILPAPDVLAAARRSGAVRCRVYWFAGQAQNLRRWLMPPSEPVHPDVRIGHVHLKVSDLDRAVAFYRDVLGFTLTQRFGTQAAFLSAGGYHHHIGLNTWESGGGTPPPLGHTGLYHAAILYPDRRELARALQRLITRRVPITGASDHGVSEAIYLNDPDGNGLELYVDRPRAEWPRNEQGELRMNTGPLDVAGLLATLQEGS
jgi:catechol 2,3-dioxygenase